MDKEAEKERLTILNRTVLTATTQRCSCGGYQLTAFGQIGTG